MRSADEKFVVELKRVVANALVEKGWRERGRMDGAQDEDERGW